MRTSIINSSCFGLAVAIAFCAAHLLAQDPTMNPSTPELPKQDSESSGAAHVLVISSMPAKKIAGSIVLNTNNERLGSIEDVVIDLASGKVSWVALGVGGVAGGLGEKLFAVPFSELKTSHDLNNNISFVLDLPKEVLDNAPGFDKDHWPDSVEPDWRRQLGAK